MKKSVLVTLVLALVFSCASVFAQTTQESRSSAVTKGKSGTIFNIPANGVWKKVQSGAVIQWSAIPAAQPQTRVDLISYAENGHRTTYYLIRFACNGGGVASAVFKPKNKLGIGMDCNGDLIDATSTVFSEVNKLPPAAAALLHQ